MEPVTLIIAIIVGASIGLSTYHEHYKEKKETLIKDPWDWSNVQLKLKTIKSCLNSKCNLSYIRF